MSELLALACAFALGSIPSGWVLVRGVRGLDVRRVGSGNIGATNAARAGGFALGALVLLCDALKGAAAVGLGRAILGPAAPAWPAAILVLAPVVGHVFTPWLGFRGGKGVATAAGALALADRPLLAVGLIVFTGVVAATRTVSAGSVSAAAAVGVGAFFLHGAAPRAWCLAAAAVLLIVRHERNIRRLLAGEEPRLTSGSRASGSS